MDTRMLMKKGNRWYLNFAFGKKFKEIEGKKIRISLGTADYKQAKNLRNLFIIPLLAAKSELQVLNKLYESIAKEVSSGVAQAHRDFKKQLHEHNPIVKLPSAQFTGDNSGDDEKNITIGCLINEYLKFMDERSSLSKRSISKVKSALYSFRFILGDDFKSASVTKDIIDNYVNISLRLPVGWGKGLKKKSLNEILAENYQGKTVSKANVRMSLIYVKSLLTWGMEKEKLPFNFRNPIIDLKSYIGKVSRVEKRAPTEDEVTKLCNMPKPRNEDAICWQYMPIIAKYSGMRLSEISQICRKDIHKEHGVLCFDICHDTKTQSSKRMVPISDKLKPYVESLLRESKLEKLFENCGDLVRDNITMKHAHRYVKFFNIYAKKVSPDLSFHNLRHYASTQLQKEGVEKLLRDKLLGHSNDTTSAIYTHPELVELKKAVDKII